MTTKNEINEMGLDNELHALFLDELADLHKAVKQLTKALPKMAKATNSKELADAFRPHLGETEQHLARIEQFFKSLDEKVKTKKCKAMEGLLAEGSELMEEKKDSSALNSALTAAAQTVKHYENASYRSVCARAERMGHVKELANLNEMLEKTADEKHTEIAANETGEEA